jgi:hypothetical protein
VGTNEIVFLDKGGYGMAAAWAMGILLFFVPQTFEDISIKHHLIRG